MPRGAKPRFTDQQILDVYSRYANGEDPADLAKELGLARKSLYENFKRRGLNTLAQNKLEAPVKIAITPKPLTKRYWEDFFEKIDSEESAYWLGFLTADGYIREDKGTVRLKLASEDEDHVIRWSESFNSGTRMGNFWYENNYKAYACQIESSKLVEDLVKYGCGQRKSFTTKWNPLGEAFERHFIRGLFDGNGWWTLNEEKNRNVGFNIEGTTNLLEGVQAVLERDCSLPPTKLINHGGKGGDLYSMNYTGVVSVAKIFTYLYTNSTVWLPRKRDHILPYLKERGYVN